MSRCFPFPPPGYEGKSRTDDVDLLKKERRREKKRKKEEKEKEKKERRENGEKEGRDGKHKDKKDKKEKKKKRDKDKDKDNGKDKSKISATDRKGFPAQAQGLNDGNNLHQKEIKQNDKAFLFDDRLTKQYASYNGEKARENNHQVDENRDSKFRMELDRRIRDSDGGAGNSLAQKFSTADRGKDEETVMLVAKSIGAGSSTWPDGKEKFQDRGVNAKKIVGRGIQAETRSIGNATVQNHVVDGKKIGTWPDGKEKFQDKGVDTKKIDGRGIRIEARPIGNATVQNHVDGKKIGTWPDGKEKFQDKGVDSNKIEGRGIWTEARPIGNATVQNHAGNCLPRVDEKPRPLENNFDKILEGAEKAKEKKDDKRGDKRKDDKKGDKRKEKDKKKKGHGKDKDRDKEKKKEEKAKQKLEYRNGEQNKLKDSNKASPVGPNSSTQVSKNYHENSIFEENLKKRKEIDSNGVLHVNDSRPIKLPRPSSSHPFSENGRTLEPCQISLQSVSDGPRDPINGKLENKERKKNGIIEAPTSVVSPNKIPTAIVPAVPTTKVSPSVVSANKIPTAIVSADPATKVSTSVVSPNKIPTAIVPADPATKVSTSVVSLNKIPTATLPADPVTKVSTKPPHPDTKYISQVYSVPKANEWSDFVDQEWLFDNNRSQEQKPVVKSSEVADTLQVWAEAVHIEPADVFALPYVIPY
ncbi:uncharacterized protein LOC127083187 isoform X2 [Lathyrus oleraceus]|uniref:uncharacterized protein LOC127083187 isoform X2 n=1 Tax=Pisum sativum TaxID=3888 RepID=UPI0021CE144F|nr:uncharacterized protein LOC127083187 isoform X2 [Pisum sativum]